VLFAQDGPTEQFPDALNAALDATSIGARMYGDAYRNHPSPFARWNEEAFCAGATNARGNLDPAANPNAESCYPARVPHVGVTHDRDGTRLLTDRGLPLPAGVSVSDAGG
jgi:hypothetical protein